MYIYTHAQAYVNVHIYYITCMCRQIAFANCLIVKIRHFASFSCWMDAPPTNSNATTAQSEPSPETVCSVVPFPQSGWSFSPMTELPEWNWKASLHWLNLSQLPPPFLTRTFAFVRGYRFLLCSTC